jgi:hypothetical protein
MVMVYFFILYSIIAKDSMQKSMIEGKSEPI